MIVACHLFRGLMMSILWWWCNQNLLFNSLTKKVDSRNRCSSGDLTQDGSVLDPVSTLLDSDSKINAIHPAFAERLGLVVQTTNVGAQKINGTTLETYGMVVAAFSVTDQANRVRFFKETFLVVNVSPDVVLRMPFLTLSGANVNFPKRELWWRSYTIEEAFPTTKQVELVGKKEFAAAFLDPGHETFVVHVASLESPSSTQEGDVHLFYRAQIASIRVTGIDDSKVASAKAKSFPSSNATILLLKKTHDQEFPAILEPPE